MTQFNEIFLSTRRLISDVVGKIVPQSEVEDIVQDTFLKAHAVKDKDRIQKPAAFMVQIAKNLAYDHVKSARYKTHSELDDETLAFLDTLESDSRRDATVQHVASQQDFSRFCTEVKKLPEKCRKVFIMKKVYGYSQKEIAESEGISASTVEKHIAYGTKRLFHLMKNNMDIQRSEHGVSSIKASVVRGGS